jgi:hypothetical protein
LREVVEYGLIGNAPIDLIVFEPGDGHVVSSSDLQRALQKRGSSCGDLVAVGYDFTQEARSKIENLEGKIFSERGSWGWTDERWNAVHK